MLHKGPCLKQKYIAGGHLWIGSQSLKLRLRAENESSTEQSLVMDIAYKLVLKARISFKRNWAKVNMHKEGKDQPP